MGKATFGNEQQVRPATKQPVVPTPKPSVLNGTEHRSQPFVQHRNPIFEDYTTYKPNHQPTEFEYDGETYKRYLPDKVLDFFNYEFDYLELAKLASPAKPCDGLLHFDSITLRGDIGRRWRRFAV